MYATNDISTTNYTRPADYSDAYPSNGDTSSRQPKANNFQATPVNQPGDFRSVGPGPWAPFSYSSPKGMTPPGTFIERPADQPPGAPNTGISFRSEGDLSDYRVNSNNLRGLQPDNHGIYVRNQSDRSKSYFTKIDGNTYQVGGFDRSDTSWRVLDPQSGKEVFKVQKENGKWVAKDLAPPAKSYPPGPKGRMFKALDGGIENVRQAKTQLNRDWDSHTSSAMRSLFGGGAFTPSGKARIQAGLDNTLRAMETTKRQNGRNLSQCQGSWPGGPSAQAWPSTGEICFSPYALRSWRDGELNELAVHEHTHTGAYTNDNWYLKQDLSRYPNWSGYTAPFTFSNALNNADTMARATSVLANNQPGWRMK